MDGLGPEAWDAVVRRAQVHKVAPILYDRLRPVFRENAVPEDAEERLRRNYLSNVGRNTRLFHESGRLLALLNRNGIRVTVLKGAHLAESVYGNIGLRSMSDLDLLVRRQDLKRVMQCIEDGGFLSPETPVNLDVQTTISFTIADLDIPMEEVLERTVPIVINGNAARGLCPEDLLLHLVLHLAVSDLFRVSGLRGLCDIRETIHRFCGELDWEVITSRAEDWRVGNAACLALGLARELLGARVPEPIPGGLDSAVVDPAVKEWALGQIFGKKEGGQALSPFFWDLWRRGSVRGRIKTLKRLVFPPTESLAPRYRGRYGSKRNSFYYLVRMRGHLAPYAGAVRRILAGDRKMLARLKNEKRNLEMQEWLVSR